MSGKIALKPRRPKPVNFGQHHNVRLGAAEEAAVRYMREALAKQRGADVEKVSFSEALRLLLGENVTAARALAADPSALPRAEALDLPIEFWDGLTDCRNKLSHSQGSLHVILRKLNFDETVSKGEVREAFDAVQESRAAIARLEAHAVALVTSLAGAGAEAETEAA